MSSSVVFDLRREKLWDEAYLLALDLYQNQPFDLWNYRAFAWVLIDLIRERDANVDEKTVQTYVEQLHQVIQRLTQRNQLEDSLKYHYQYALDSLLSCAQELQNAQQLSRQQNFAASIAIYQQLFQQNVLQAHHLMSFGWDIFRYCRQLLAQEEFDVTQIKKLLMLYLQIKPPIPSPLHSSILQWVALPFYEFSQGQFHFAKFLALWGLDAFQQEDLQPKQDEQGNRYASLFNRAVSASFKVLIKRKELDLLSQFLPVLDQAIQLEPQYIWFSYYKAQSYALLEDYDQAIQCLIPVLKHNMSEAWVWNYCAELYALQKQAAMAIACYCKALVCSRDEQLTQNIRLYLSQGLVRTQQYHAAKAEINILATTLSHLPYVQECLSSEWYQNTEVSDQNGFYQTNIALAESILHQHLEWMTINIGHQYENKEKKKRIKVYSRSKQDDLPFEHSISVYHFKDLDYQMGSSVLIKGELDELGRLKVYTVKADDSNQLWSLFDQHIGVISYINHDKAVSHLTFDLPCEVFVSQQQLPTGIHLGDCIAAGLAKRYFQEKLEYTAINVQPTEQTASSKILKRFKDYIQTGDGFAFTYGDGVFITPDLVRQHQLKDGDYVQGMSLLNFNKKRRSWGWKAIQLEKIDATIYDYDEFEEEFE